MIFVSKPGDIPFLCNAKVRTREYYFVFSKELKVLNLGRVKVGR